MSITGRKVRVLIVDDSALVRKLATDALSKDPEIEVVGTALDPIIAKEKIQRLKPDVLTLDIEMPRMDGLTFLRLLMQEQPMPVIIMSSLSTEGSHVALDALQAGAVDVLAKPGSSYQIGELAVILPEKVKAAAESRVRRPTLATPPPSLPPPAAPARPPLAQPPSATPLPPPTAVSASVPAPVVESVRPRLVSPFSVGRPPEKLVPVPSAGGYHPRQILLLGASTGGTEALKEVLTRMPGNLPPIAIVQHIPPYFSKTFAERLNSLCHFEVREAVDGERLRPGLCVVAPGGWHMLLKWAGDQYLVHLKQGPPVWHQRPAVDVLFNTAADCAGANAVAAVLTGMGRDGADGLLKLRQKGARTFAQNEETCVVFGMPRVAMELGAAEQMVPLLDFPRVLVTALDLARKPSEA